MPFLAGFAVFVFRRRLMRGGRETGISTSAASTVRDDEAIAGSGEIVKQLAGVGVVDHGANGSRDFFGFAIVPGAIAAFAVASALGFVLGIKAEVEKSVVMLGGDHDDVASAPAVASAGAAARDILFAPKRQAAVAAVAGLHIDFNFVDEHHRAVVSSLFGP